MKKKSNRKKLVNKLDKLVSLIVRHKYGRCILCGKPMSVEKLQAHHWIVTRAHSTKYRWDVRNLVSLCYPCHIHKIHSTASYRYLEDLKKKAILYRVCTKKDIEEIAHDYKLAEFSIRDLEEILTNLENIAKGMGINDKL